MPSRSTIAAALCLALAAPAALWAGDTTEQALGLMLSSNDTLRAQGMDYMAQQMDLYEGGTGLESVRIHQQEHRWMPDDARRKAQGRALSYLVVTDAWSPFAVADAEPVADRAIATWAREHCLDAVPIYKRPDAGEDATLFDAAVGQGELGDPLLADIVIGGFLPDFSRHFGSSIVAATVTYVFVDAAGEPTDLDGDGHFDTAHSEIYLNPDYDWRLDAASGDPAVAGYDLESALLHDFGHGLGLGHVKKEGQAVMSPGYLGVARVLQPRDQAGLCAVFQED